MKKIAAAVLSLCMILCLVSCGETEPAPVDPVPQPEPEPVPVIETKEYTKALTDEASALEFLKGEWSMCPMGVQRDEQTTTITFMDDATVEVVRDDGEFALCKVSMNTLMSDSNGSLNMFTLDPYEFSKNFTSGDSSYYIGVDAMFQFLVCRADGIDLLMIREPGNGESQIGYEGFGYNLLAGDTNAWLFYRNNGIAPRDHEETISLRHKNDTFYAYCWCCAADYYMLQEVSLNDFLTEWGDSQVYVGVMEYADNDHPLEGVFYDSAAIPGEGDMGLPDIFQLMLGKVTTDEDGIVVDFEQLDYMAYGAYFIGGTPWDQYPISIMEEDGTIAACEDYTECRITDDDQCIQIRAEAKDVVYKVRVVKLTMLDMEDAKPNWFVEEIYEQDELVSGKPLLITAPYLMDMPTYGLLIRDKDGADHLYEIWQSGYDGSLMLNEAEY